MLQTPIDKIQDVPESQQTGLQLCSFDFQLKMDTYDLARGVIRGTGRGTSKNDSTAHFGGVRVLC